MTTSLGASTADDYCVGRKLIQAWIDSDADSFLPWFAQALGTLKSHALWAKLRG